MMGCIFVFLDCASGLSDGVEVLILRFEDRITGSWHDEGS